MAYPRLAEKYTTSTSLGTTLNTIEKQQNQQQQPLPQTMTMNRVKNAISFKRARKSQLKNINKTQSNVPLDPSDLIKAIINMNKKKASEQKKKHSIFNSEHENLKAGKRDRFKKSENPMDFIKYFIEHENFRPNQEEIMLVEKMITIKAMVAQSHDLNLLLNKIYTLMNITVDCNQLRFLCLLIMLAAEISLEMKDCNRAFYFYNQARVAATYSHMIRLKTQALKGMALVTMELKQYNLSLIFLKKSLQYAWKAKSTEFQLGIYDLMGESFFYEGILSEANYYHVRFMQGEVEGDDSAIKKISEEMLREYDKQNTTFETRNLSSLFIEYLSLPITSFSKIPKQDNIKVHDNYLNGDSPRRNRQQQKIYEYTDFLDAHFQIDSLLKNDSEFQTEVPNPDTHQSFVSVKKYGPKRKIIEFEKSSEYHRLIGYKAPKPSFESIYNFPLQKRIEKALTDHADPEWWPKLCRNVKKDRSQKVGKLKSSIRTGHFSYNKYPDERRRTQSLRTEKIKESFNKTLLDWIDPPK